ncbi:MAG: thiol:disulfide interchange protein DsbA/DsbL [Gammaproteobacteria bacterium]|jgi:protein dithiol oxidoreductase (disulfide-forming)|nr:thiol:disulfide interchange protein DsbA/DsbL [Gammaproteobacteria bacterium]
MFKKLLALTTLAVLAACSPSPQETTAQPAMDTPAAIEASAAETETASTVVIDAAAPTASQSMQYQQGAHYERFTNAQGTSSSPDKIEVAEIFWYGCGHCFSFEPYLQKWKKTLGSDVSFVKHPVMWNPTNEIHARLFYTAQALGLDEADGDIFSEIHTNRKMLASESAQRDFITSKYDVSKTDFDKAYRSFSVNGKLQQAKNWTQRYKVRSVPLLVINGKYAVVGPELSGYEQLLDVADELIDRERQER